MGLQIPAMLVKLPKVELISKRKGALLTLRLHALSYPLG